MDDLFFVASKVFWMLARPATWGLLLVLAALWAVEQGRRGLARASLWGAALGFVLVATVPVGDALLAPLEGRFPAAPPLSAPALILVLGGAEQTVETAGSGLPSVNGAGERFIEAIALAHRFPDAQIGVVGGSGRLQGPAMPNAEILARALAAAGIPPARIGLETASRNTWENAVNARGLWGDTAGPVVLVTSAFHMPRAAETFCAAGWPAFIAYPVDFRAVGSFQRLGWAFADNLSTLNLAVKEHIGRVVYRLTGRAAPVTTGSGAQAGRVICPDSPG